MVGRGLVRTTRRSGAGGYAGYLWFRADTGGCGPPRT